MKGYFHSPEISWCGLKIFSSYSPPLLLSYCTPLPAMLGISCVSYLKTWIGGFLSSGRPCKPFPFPLLHPVEIQAVFLLTPIRLAASGKFAASYRTYCIVSYSMETVRVCAMIYVVRRWQEETVSFDFLGRESERDGLKEAKGTTCLLKKTDRQCGSARGCGGGCMGLGIRRYYC